MGISNIYQVEYKKETTFSVAPSGSYNAIRVEERPDFAVEQEIIENVLREYKLQKRRDLSLIHI